MSLLKRNRRRLETAPDVTDVLGLDEDDKPRDWYHDSDILKSDILGEGTEGESYEEAYAPDFGSYNDHAISAHNANPLCPIEDSDDV